VPASIEPETASALQMTDADYRQMTTFLMDTRENLMGHPEIKPLWMNLAED